MLTDIARVVALVMIGGAWFAAAGAFIGSLLGKGKAKDRVDEFCALAAITTVAAFLVLCLLGIIALAKAFWG